MKKCCIWYLFL